MNNTTMGGMIPLLIAAIALGHGGARTYTIQLDRLAAPAVNGHRVAGERDAAHVFGAPSHRSGCTAVWAAFALEVDTCGIGVEISATGKAWRTAAGLRP